MREDHSEALDKMFPHGYVLLYACPNLDLRLALYNPHRHKAIHNGHEIARLAYALQAYAVARQPRRRQRKGGRR